ncbi:MAG: DUF885 domain-containing protein [Rothia sp. (in: high G+C Gram-positive bacteria)]|nr:DUF885 domain-containing protein [Rothia sp. (in: high G+C Gram-positive bacteria)]
MSKLSELPDVYRQQRQSTEIDAIANDFYEKSLELYPEDATLAGRKGRETEYGDRSPAGHQKFMNLVKSTLGQLSQATPQDNVDRVTLAAMRERLGLHVELDEAGLGTWEINNIACAVQDIRSVFDLMNRASSTDWKHIAGRMHEVGGAVDGFIQSLEKARAEGKVAARRQVDIVIEQTDAYIASDGFFTQLAAEVTENAPEYQNEAEAGAKSAIEGYTRLNTYLRETLLPVAPEKDAVGKERYALYSRQFLGATIDLEESYAWGVQELDRIIAEQEQVAHEIKDGASIAEAKNILDADPARILHGTDALQQWMQKLADQAVEDLASKYFVIEGAMREIECMIAPTQEGGIYYTQPSPDFERPGRMWWSVPEGEDTFGTWREVSTVYHEGVPGHHLQTAVATAMAETMNHWRSNGVWVSGHGEGWALYSERLMEELGYLADPGDRMGMLDAQRLRAARVVFDIGVHCELEIPERWVSELGIEPGIWTAEKGFTFLEANLDLSPGQLRFEYLRYLGWPGQAPSYKIGQRIWEQLREQARAAGTAGEFDRDFHTRALKLGSMGLDTLQEALKLTD